MPTSSPWYLITSDARSGLPVALLADYEQAERRFREFEEAANAAHHRPWVELDRAAIAAARGDADEAQARLAAGEVRLAEAGLTQDPDDQYELDWLRAQVRS